MTAISIAKTGENGRSSRAPEQAPVTKTRTAGSSGAIYPGDVYGIVTAAAARRATFARYIRKPCLLPVKTHKIEVNCLTGERTVETDLPSAATAIVVPRPAHRPYVFKSQTVRKAVLAVATTWDVRPQDLMSASRHQKFVLPRFACFRLLRQIKWSTPQIGTAIHRDHTTVMSGLKRAKELWRHNKGWRAKYDAAWAEFKGEPT